MERLAKITGHLRTGEFKEASLSPNETSWSTVGAKRPDDVVIVSALRTAIGKARKGSFKDTLPDTLLTAVLKATVDQTGLKPEVVDDIVVGNVQLGGSYAAGARMAMLVAGFPASVPVSAVNRQCSSGLQAVANVAASIKAGLIDVGIGAGVESMTQGGGVAPGTGNNAPPPFNFTAIMENDLARQCLTPMGVTSENVAERYGITRAQQDQMAFESHTKALAAQAHGYFKNEIVPVTTTVTDKEGNESEITVTKDDGPRKGTTMARLAKLRTVFKADGGTTTAGNASQVSDGAAAVLLMKRAKAQELGLNPIGCFRGYKVVGVRPDEMGIGPAAAIPPALAQCGLKIDDVDTYEINEAFASQAVYCVNKLGIDMKKVNPNGGAIALGHPLACTGARQVATLLHHLHRTNGKVGVVSMCIGTGMGMAAVIEAE
mmetsp:Transcript_2270/g.2667  ORF Transcript_2270/g.2667 Transcript_2270/m.2667 type:complete len:432 (+) Transcript_2270:24-1319(+)|eukprot:CAMPEP_0205824842 /NCGR_PEP_ID=MMETSP0206-20130828/22945_1 /ASSEMBLY_ACC=CAM_ASM_000279 /TAXON_ID=36767 /ORGANISM="Euplotes focardii, Strain TN1" /LENGTH=431 /DNA_ID=CAMNT_0053123345 /DNA_START=27 /DNA_END=1322 /DNA_ORIENTATION=+